MRNNSRYFDKGLLPNVIAYYQQQSAGLKITLKKKSVRVLIIRKCAITIKDRNIHYQQYYAIGGGHAWSKGFSAASQRTLGWSHGTHGLRHTYAQQRTNELQQQGFFYPEALSIINQELGHFRADITEVYCG